jgi:hypothetical protein
VADKIGIMRYGKIKEIVDAAEFLAKYNSTEKTFFT